MSDEEITNPAFRAMVAEMRGINARLDGLINMGKPKPFVLDIKEISKAAAFDDQEVDCIGVDLLQVSTDGNLGDVSYKIKHLDGSESLEMEASESPHVLGPIISILIINDTAEAGKSIRVARYQGPLVALAAIKHGTPQAVSIAASGRMFYAEAVEYVVGADNLFEDDEAMGEISTHYMTGAPLVNNILIHTIKYQIIPTAAETYQLYLLEAATAEDQQQEAEIIFDSGAGQIGGTIYIHVAGGAPTRLPILARLTDPGVIFYQLDWSGAPGNTAGYIRVYGEVLG